MPKKILVVEDNADLREFLSFNLERAGFIVNNAVDGEDALAKARLLMPDLILLDVMMPDVDGFTVSEVLRRDPATTNIFIIMLTGLDSELSRLRGLETGADDYFSKPVDSRKLILRIEDLLYGKVTIAPQSSK